MPDEPECYAIARTMLGVEELPADLQVRLFRINQLVGTAVPSGVFRSWQTTAVVVEQWLRDNGQGPAE